MQLVTRDELLAGVRNKIGTKKTLAVFGRMDTDNSGKVTLSQFKNYIMRMTEDDSDEVFDKKIKKLLGRAKRGEQQHTKKS